MFSGRPYVRDSRGSFMFPRYLQYLLIDFRQTFVTGLLSILVQCNSICVSRRLIVEYYDGCADA